MHTPQDAPFSTKTWYRVVFRKDGSVYSCTEAGSTREAERYVCYVEALDQADAIQVAASRYRQMILKIAERNRVNRDKHSKQGLCSDCTAPALPGRRRCGVHAEVIAANSAVRRARESADSEKITDAQHRLAAAKQAAKSQTVERGRRMSVADYTRKAVLKEVQAQFKRLSTQAFSRWLNAEAKKYNEVR